ncbi:CMD domain protein [Tessaracoccus palaemonis]|uniref:CMD domain protein n=1 Tax=Tessaracoccus palaemonis TaxID=2829499 RepID=UPI0021071E5F|nr:CMD domain protein [Tessaracoccus palaemonis]
MSDIIDLISGAGPDVHALRDARPQARENAQLSFEALFEPAEPGTFAPEERLAVAAFVSALHGDEDAAAFYGDLLADVADPAFVAAVAESAAALCSQGPTGTYREPALAPESTPTVDAVLPPAQAELLGRRLAAGLEHAHVLVFHPRDSRQERLETLILAGWSLEDIVSLSQAVAFLSFQLRAAAGLRALAAEEAS